MNGKKCKFLASKKQFSLLRLDEKLQVLTNYDQYKLNTHDIFSLINSLPSKVRLNELEVLFKCYELYNITFDEVIEFYSHLKYQDKMHLLDILSTYEIKNHLLDTLTESEIYRFFKEPPLCSNKDIRDYLVQKLSPNTCCKFFNKLSTMNHVDAKISLIKNIPEATLINFLENNIKYVNKDNFIYSKEIQRIYVAIISHLSNEEIKLSCLNTNNKYHLNLDSYEKLTIVKTLHDNYKLQIIKDDYLPFGLYEYQKISKSLSDKTLISLINDKSFIEKYFDNNLIQLIKLLSPQSCHYLLENRHLYLSLYHKEYLLELIKGIPNSEKILIIKPDNKYHINLNNEEIIKVIRTLSDDDKLNIFNQNTFNFNEEELFEIIESIKETTLINKLLTGKLQITTIDMLSKVINYLSRELSPILINNHNYKLQSFIKRYRKIIINNLNLPEQLRIFRNPSENSLKLTDDELITILLSISKTGYVFSNCNILSFFNNPAYFVDYFLDNMPNFSAFDDKIIEDIIKYYIKKHHLKVDANFMCQILKYNTNSKILFQNYDSFTSFFKAVNIDINNFIQYGINNHKVNYLEIILLIIINNEIPIFNNFKNYLFTNYYHNISDSRNTIKVFLEVIQLYNQYPALSRSLLDNNQELSSEEHEDLRYLLNQNNPLENIQTLTDIKKYRQNIITSYQNTNNETTINELRNKLSQLLFSKDYHELDDLLTITGNEENIEIMKFNNRNHRIFTSYCDDLLIITNLIEQIISISDINILKNYFLYFTNPNNYEYTKTLSNFCLKYEENIRKLYELDLQLSLTNINNLPDNLRNTELALKLRRKYGGEVIDLSNTNYVLGAHIPSRNETIDSLINGTSNGHQNYISLSAITHRNQRYYSWDDDIPVLAYDNLPENSFICSANHNLGTNGYLHENTLEIPRIIRRQKGVHEISECNDDKEQNSEILLYRDNMHPCGIIVPNKSKITREAIKYHKKYHLPFIITQEVGKTIPNPKKLPNQNKNISFIMANDNELAVLRRLEQDLQSLNQTNPRRIAVITDPHALYEPTLAALLDIKHQGISEIYSLGDNIGHGPNPKEVLELLDRFNVQSVYGNHEIYLHEGLENFQGHFPSEESIDRTLTMLKWMKQELTHHQIEKIKNYPERYELNIAGTNPLTLIHTTKPYTHHGKYSIAPHILSNSFIVQGHDHFASKKSDQDITLRGVGIGQNAINDGMAAYTIIEFQDNDYHIENRYVNYNRSNLLHTINESSMPTSAKQLIRKWVGK